MPVSTNVPPVVARPWADRGRVEVQPLAAALGPREPPLWIDLDAAHVARSTTSAPSATQCPATLWPPPRTAIGRPAARAARTAATTSSVERHWTMTAGRLSIIPLNDFRAVVVAVVDGQRARFRQSPRARRAGRSRSCASSRWRHTRAIVGQAVSNRSATTCYRGYHVTAATVRRTGEHESR